MLIEFNYPSLAGAIFNEQQKYEFFKDVIYHSLKDFFERSSAEFKRFDHYDLSIEFWCKPSTILTDEEKDILKLLGFDRCWLCYRDDKQLCHKLGETHYYFGLR